MDETRGGPTAAANSDPERMTVAALRLVGASMVVVALGLWLLTATGLRWTPASLVVGGAVLLTVPDIAAELLAG